MRLGYDLGGRIERYLSDQPVKSIRRIRFGSKKYNNGGIVLEVFKFFKFYNKGFLIS